jgi:hypothetical protein
MKGISVLAGAMAMLVIVAGAAPVVSGELYSTSPIKKKNQKKKKKEKKKKKP